MTIMNMNRVMITWCYLLFLMLSAATTSQQQETLSTDQSEPVISKNMAVAFVALITAFFILGLFSFYTRFCTEGRFGRSPGNVPIAGGGGIPWRSARGLDATYIATFPTFMYSSVKGHKIGKTSLECAVCLNEFENSDTLRLIPKCSHVFHSVCIDAWLVSHNTCPVCRANLLQKPTGEVKINFDSGSGSDGPGIERNRNQVVSSPLVNDHISQEEATELNVVTNSSQTPNRTSPVWSPMVRRFSGMFQRSNSTGHERFTLRLPVEVRSQLMNSTLNRTRSWTELPNLQSSRRGYRSGGEVNGNNGKNILVRTLSFPTPIFGRSGIGRTPSPERSEEEDIGDGERSFARLKPKGIDLSTEP